MRHRKILAWAVAPALVATGVAIYIISMHSVILRRLDRVAAGICLDEDRVLTQEELTRRVRRSFLRGLVDEAKYMNSEVWARSFRVAVIYEDHPIDLIHQIKSAGSNSKSTEQNFNAISIYDGVSRPDYRGLAPSRPLTIVSVARDGYGYGGASTRFYDFRRLNPYVGAASTYVKLMTQQDRVAGFGTYFFLLPSADIVNDCCDAPWHGEPRSLYLTGKSRAVQETLNSIKKSMDAEIEVLPVSTCGDVLMNPSPMNGANKVVTYRDMDD